VSLKSAIGICRLYYLHQCQGLIFQGTVKQYQPFHDIIAIFVVGKVAAIQGVDVLLLMYHDTVINCSIGNRV